MRYCEFEGCNNKHFGLGYCKTHYTQFKRHGKVTKIKPLSVNVEKVYCSIDGCDNIHRAKGYCQKHYLQVRKYGKVRKDLERIHRGIDECQVVGCNNKHFSKGYCAKHYMKNRRGTLR